MHDRTSTLDDLLEAVAARQPAPASGSVAAVAGALAASMGEMVLNYSLGKKGLEAHENKHREAWHEMHRARQLMLGLMVEDQAAYEAFSEVRKQPPDAPQRQEKFNAALLACIRIPEAMGAVAVSILELCDHLVETVSQYMLCDLAVCADLAMATTRCALHNVRVNLDDVADKDDRTSIETTMHQVLSRAAILIQRVSPRIWERYDAES